MKALGLLVTILVLLSSCASDPVTSSEHMIFSSQAFRFQHGDSLTAVSITHSCTCPFTWTSTLTANDTLDTLAWLGFPKSMAGDQHEVPIVTHPWLYPHDTNRASILIKSNSYGNETISVTAIR